MKKSVFNIYPAEGVTITVRGNKSRYLRCLEKGEFAYHRFEVVYISPKDARTLCKLADDRDAHGGSWHAHCRDYNMDIIYSRPIHSDAKTVYVNTWANYRKYTKKS